MEDESSSIKCAATNLKKMNYLCSLSKTRINQKSIYIASIQNQNTHQTITNRKSSIPKPILRVSFQKELAQDQSKTDIHSINPINLNGIRFSFVWKLGSEKFHSSKHGCHSFILSEVVRERGGEKLFGMINFKSDQRFFLEAYFIPRAGHATTPI